MSLGFTNAEISVTDGRIARLLLAYKGPLVKQGRREMRKSQAEAVKDFLNWVAMTYSEEARKLCVAYLEKLDSDKDLSEEELHDLAWQAHYCAFQETLNQLGDPVTNSRASHD